MVTCLMMNYLVRQIDGLVFEQTDRENSKRGQVNLIGIG